MKNPISRREALRSAAVAGAGALVTSSQALAQLKPLEVAGKPVATLVVEGVYVALVPDETR